MAEFTAEDLRRIMDHKHNIRNISVIADLDHGTSTLTESLVAFAGIIAKETASDAPADEAQHGITSLYYQKTDADPMVNDGERKRNEFLINIIDIPGRVDFSSQVTAALRITDGALVVIDCIEGVRGQTETVLCKAICEGVRPVLIVNNIDKIFLKENDGEIVYQKLKSCIDKVNKLITTYTDSSYEQDFTVSPDKGTVAFSAGLHGWVFTLTTLANKDKRNLNATDSEIMESLWGENFYDWVTRKWTKEKTKTCTRGFVKLCYEPIKDIIDTCEKGKKGKKVNLVARLKELGMTIKSQEIMELAGEPLTKHVMQNWFPASTALLEMIICHLPSPHATQSYRYKNLYTGSSDDDYANAIRKCEPDDLLMVYVSKVVPAFDKGRFFAFGRVFSGKVSTGRKVRIMGPNFDPGTQNDLYEEIIEKTFVCMGKKQRTVDDVPCGNVVATVFSSKFIETATLTDVEEPCEHPIRTMRSPFSPVVRIQVGCKKKPHLLIEALKLLTISDPMVVHTQEPGKHFIVVSGESHLYACLDKLSEILEANGGSGIQLEISGDPIVSFREIVQETSDHTVMSKSLNKCNRFHMKARPIRDRLLEAINNREIVSLDHTGEALVRNFGSYEDISDKIWRFGPNETGPNMVVDMSTEEDLNDIKEIVETCFKQASKEGVLAGENMWGVCFELHDFVRDDNHNSCGQSQITEAVKDVIYASQLTAKPRLLEPVYLVEILAHGKARNAVHAVLNHRRGKLFEESVRPNTILYDIKAYLPVYESFGFYRDLRATTSGRAWTESCALN